MVNEMTEVQFTTFNKDGKTLKKVTIPTLIKETVNKYCGLRSSAVEEEGGLRQFLINKTFSNRLQRNESLLCRSLKIAQCQNSNADLRNKKDSKIVQYIEILNFKERIYIKYRCSF